MVGKDQPPDLAALVPSGSVAFADQPEKQSSPQVLIDKKHVSDDSKPTVISGKFLIKYDTQWMLIHVPLFTSQLHGSSSPYFRSIMKKQCFILLVNQHSSEYIKLESLCELMILAIELVTNSLPW